MSERYRIEGPDDTDGFPPFVVNGKATNVVFAEDYDELTYWLGEADDLGVQVTWTKEGD